MPPLLHRLYAIRECDVAVATTGAAPSALAPTVVWIHGLGAASTITFAEVAQHPVIGHLHSVLIDLPGAGFSQAPADWDGTIEDLAGVVLGAIGEMATSPVVLFGHSLGGSVAIAAATQRPDLIRQLIVAEPNLDPGVGTTSVAIARQSEAEFVARGYQQLVDATSRLARRGNVAAAAWLTTLRLADPHQLHRAATSLLANRQPTFREQLGELTMPVATISGELTPPREPPLSFMQNLRGYVVPEAGHQMFDDNPTAFVTILARCLSDMA